MDQKSGSPKSAAPARGSELEMRGFKEMTNIEKGSFPTQDAAVLTIDESTPGSPTSDTTPPPTGTLYNVLIMFIALKILMAYDSGAFSISLGVDGGITDDLNLSPSDQGQLSSIVFLGNLLGCAVAGQMFSTFSARTILVYSVIFHGIFTLLFALANNYYLSMVMRFFIGVTLAFIVVYAPIWVDMFAPSNRSTTWMALVNVGVPLGTMMGFVIGGLLPNYTSYSWRTTFFLKCIALIPVAVFTMKLDRTFVEKKRNVPTAAEQYEIDNRPEKSYAAQVCNVFVNSVYGLIDSARILLVTPLYMATVGALSSLYFVVTALQNFVTPYLQDPPFNAATDTIVMGFGFSVITAPVAGVIAGGLLLDRRGGYQTNLVGATTFAAMWGAVACVICIFCAVATTAVGFLLPMWIILFCGGAIVPVGIGVIMASVPQDMRAPASSFSNIFFSFFGYFMGPFVCGYVIDYSGSIATGIRVTLAMSGVGFIFMCLAILAAKRHIPEVAVEAAIVGSPNESTPSVSASVGALYDTIGRANGSDDSRSVASPLDKGTYPATFSAL